MVISQDFNIRYFAIFLGVIPLMFGGARIEKDEGILIVEGCIMIDKKAAFGLFLLHLEDWSTAFNFNYFGL